MFLTLLDPAQSVLFARAARLLIEADAIAHERELEMLDAIRLETGLTDIPEPGEVDELAARAVELLTDATQRNAFIAELAGVAVIDGDEHGAERELLQHFADRLGVADRLDEFLAFAHDAGELAQRGRELITTVGGV